MYFAIAGVKKIVRYTEVFVGSLYRGSTVFWAFI